MRKWKANGQNSKMKECRSTRALASGRLVSKSPLRLKLPSNRERHREKKYGNCECQSFGQSWARFNTAGDIERLQEDCKTTMDTHGLFRSFQHMDCQNFFLTGNKSGRIPSSGLVSRDYPSNSPMAEWEGIIPSLARLEPTCCRACPCCEAVATFEPLYLAETTSTILVGQMDQCIHLARSVDNETERSGLKSENHIA